MTHLHSISKSNFARLLLPRITAEGLQIKDADFIEGAMPTIALIENKVLMTGLKRPGVLRGGVVEDSFILDSEEILEILLPYLDSLGFGFGDNFRIEMTSDAVLLIDLADAQAVGEETLPSASFDVVFDARELDLFLSADTRPPELSPEDPSKVRFALWGVRENPLDVREGDGEVHLVATYREKGHTRLAFLACGSLFSMSIAFLKLRQGGWDRSRPSWNVNASMWVPERAS